MTGISPTSGLGTGGTTVTITGTDLASASAVDFGGIAATIVSDTAAQIVATSPAGSGVVDVTVTTAGGTSATSSADQFSYVPVVTGDQPRVGTGHGRHDGDDHGHGLHRCHGGEVRQRAATIVSDTATQIVATSPAGTGVVDVTVTTAGGTSATSSADQFSYVPVLTAISPSSGPPRAAPR